MAVTAGAAMLATQLRSAEPATPAGAPPAARPPGARPPADRVLGTPPPAGQRQQPQLTELKGKTVYITGGNTGIGLGIGRAAANAGMNVVMGYIQEDQVEPAMKLYKPEQRSRVIAIRHDVTDRDGWTKTLAEINAKFGNLHLLVNNAGIKTLRQASQVDARSWDAAVAVNFTGIYNGCAAVIPHMLAHKEGSHIVTTSSMGGILPGVNAGVYTATKFASCGLMEALRVELMGTNIGTSVFLPGGVSTDNIASEAGTESLMMDPLEAGERVLNGVKNNDLFLFTHPEFKPGIKERCDAILASEPQDGFPEARAKAETRVLTAPPYAPEIAHRTPKRKSYRA
ncbi:MAG TPA: SDR family NAD(P)-dependent oxidoreductase [Steroidobacteraceae bacterium]|nr:SDR family NAD(P)-dependent oxidoreductase [Steroidobacteraceae bacterium]